MSSLYLPKTDNIKDEIPLLPLLPLLLIALSVAVFVLLMMLAFLPDAFLLSSPKFPRPNGIFLLIMSTGAVFYHFLHFKYHFPPILEVIFPLLIGVVPLAASILKTGGFSAEVVLKAVEEEGQRLFITVVVWLLSAFLTNIFYKLSLIPGIIEHKWTNRRLWDDAGVRFDIRPWRHGRGEWQGSLMILTVIGALFVNQSSLASDFFISFMAQFFFATHLILTVILLIQGHFYYRRALWHVNGLEPEPTMEGTWRRWASGIVIVIFFLSMLLPGDLRGLKGWWLILFPARLFRPRDEFTYNSVEENATGTGGEQMDFQVVAEPNIWQETAFIIQVFLIILCLLTSIFGLMMLAGYSLNKFKNSDGRGLKGLAGLIRKFYLYWRAVYKKWRKRKFWSKANTGATGYRHTYADDYQWRRGGRGCFRENGLRSAVRRGYSRLIRRSRKTGLDWRPTLTPAETAANLTKVLPAEEELITRITSDYRQARYAPNEPEIGLVRTFLRRVRILTGKLRSYFSKGL